MYFGNGLTVSKHYHRFTLLNLVEQGGGVGAKGGEGDGFHGSLGSGRREIRQRHEMYK
jgi:hypothetical protein